MTSFIYRKLVFYFYPNDLVNTKTTNPPQGRFIALDIQLFQGRSQDFSKGGGGGGGSQRLLTRSPSGDRRLYMVYTAAFPRVSAGSVVLSRHEGPY